MLTRITFLTRLLRAPPWSKGSVLDDRSLPPVFESRRDISEGCFVFDFASLPSEVAGLIYPTMCTKVAVKHQSSSDQIVDVSKNLHGRTMDQWMCFMLIIECIMNYWMGHILTFLLLMYTIFLILNVIKCLKSTNTCKYRVYYKHFTIHEFFS